MSLNQKTNLLSMVCVLTDQTIYDKICAISTLVGRHRPFKRDFRSVEKQT